MLVFIDTSIIVGEGFFRSESARLFLKAARFLGISVFILEIVIDEVKGQFSVKLRESLTDFNKAQKSLNSLIGMEVRPMDVKEEAIKYCEWLDDFLREYKVDVLPYPRIATKEIVEESYRAQKPFKRSGAGHKDYIVWKTISSHINSTEENEEVCFVTNNTADFCEKFENKIVLHSHLAEQLKDGRDCVQVYTSLNQYFLEKVHPVLEVRVISDIPELSANELKREALDRLEDELSLRSVNGLMEFWLWNEATVHSVEEAKIDTLSTAKLDEKYIMVSVFGSILVEVGGYMNKEDFQFEAAEDVFVWDGDWNEREMWLQKTVGASFRVVMSYNRETKKVDGYAVELED